MRNQNLRTHGTEYVRKNISQFLSMFVRIRLKEEHIRIRDDGLRLAHHSSIDTG